MQKHLSVDRLQSILSCCKHLWVQKTVKLFEIILRLKMDMGGEKFTLLYKKKNSGTNFQWLKNDIWWFYEIYDQVLFLVWQVI